MPIKLLVYLNSTTTLQHLQAVVGLTIHLNF